MNIFEQWAVDAREGAMNATVQRIRAEQYRTARREWWARVAVLAMLALVVVARWVWGA